MEKHGIPVLIMAGQDSEFPYIHEPIYILNSLLPSTCINQKLGKSLLQKDNVPLRMVLHYNYMQFAGQNSNVV